jgi:PKD repeat protein
MFRFTRIRNPADRLTDMLNIRAVNPRTLITLTLAALLLSVTGHAADLGIDPTDEEQFGIYELNRARHDPEAYGDRIGLDLSGVSPQPPLAVNRNLTASARFHCDEMADNDYFGHVSDVTGDGPNQMAVDHGYDVFGSGLDADWGTANHIESIAYGLNMIPTFEDAIEMLIIDEGVASLGHRIHLLAMSSFFQDHREVGCGRAGAGFRDYYAIHTSNVSTSDRFLTGVVYTDANKNGRYDLGEGLGGVTVSTGGAHAVTMDAGGYSLPVSNGSYTVSCSGGDFLGLAFAAVEVSGSNVEVDFRSGYMAGDVDFVLSPALAPQAEIDASATSGDAPLTVAFSGWSDEPLAVLTWDFGDGDRYSGSDVAHVFDEPGVYPVVLTATNGQLSGNDLVVVTVNGATGAGAGTTAPSTTSVEIKSLKAKAKFDRLAGDSVKLKLKLEMPAGFVPGAHAVEVCVGSVRMAFEIEENGKALNLDGSKVKLRYDKPKKDAPLGAGIIAKLKVTMKGDLASRLAALGLRNTTETLTIEGLPIAVMLNELTYRGDCRASVASKAAKKSVARLIE